jgi:hypothetical protein
MHAQQRRSDVVPTSWKRGFPLGRHSENRGKCSKCPYGDLLKPHRSAQDGSEESTRGAGTTENADEIGDKDIHPMLLSIVLLGVQLDYDFRVRS